MVHLCEFKECHNALSTFASCSITSLLDALRERQTSINMLPDFFSGREPEAATFTGLKFAEGAKK